jgi:hypothetical protein
MNRGFLYFNNKATLAFSVRFTQCRQDCGHMHTAGAAINGAILMNTLLGNRFSGLRDNIHRNWQEKALRRDRAAEFLHTLETVVDDTDSKIRLVPGYKKKLRNNIQSSLEFADELVKQIPEAIEVSSSTFVSDPYVNAFFTNVADLQSVFCHSSEMHDYMEDSHADGSRCCALLCMRRTEKSVAGMELSDNMLKRDVLQVAVSFSDHRIYSPTPFEPETREGLKCCLFQGLVTNALERIVKLKLASHRLQSNHQMLHARLRRYKQRAIDVKKGTKAGVKLARGIEETRLELRKIEEQIMNSPLLTPQIALEQVMAVFSKPDDFVRVRKFPLKLNKMGIKISDNSPQPCNRIDLTEVTIGNELPRVITLATFPGRELVSETVFSMAG